MCCGALKSERTLPAAIPYDTLNRLGFYGGPFIWQLSTDLAHGEIFADMFIGWVYDKWQLKKDGSMSVEGGKKAEFMKQKMTLAIAKALH